MPQPLRFHKMHGCGNDYVYINTFKQQINRPEVLARRVASRHYGIGSDGLILLAPPRKGGDARMIMYNADGSESEMCGNGIRCLAKLTYDLGICKNKNLQIETKAGTKSIELCFENDQVVGAKVDMGIPRFDRSDLPMTGQGSAVDAILEVNGEKVIGTGVSMGNPHFVMVSEAIDDALVARLGPQLENHQAFPERANIGFLEIISRSFLRLRVWERGSGETMACGTGASAAFATAVKTNRCHRSAACHLKGGVVELSWPADDAGLILSGPATTVFHGELLDY